MATCTVSMSGIRSPALMARSRILSPSHVTSYSATQSIPRNLHPFQIRTNQHDRTRLSSQSTRVITRKFSSSSHKRSAQSSAIPHISVHIAASSSGKGSKFQAERSTHDYLPDANVILGLQKDEHTIFQKRRSRPDSGQDAYFAAPVGGDTGETAFGVCDGVGGWTDHGVDPADFSHGLCSHMVNSAMNWRPTSKEQGRMKPQQLMEDGYQRTVKDPEIKAGGTTVCVGIIDTKGQLRMANLGDSGFVHLRLGTVQNYSTPQTHAFNTPYQMSVTPPEMIAQAMIFGGLPLNDEPERADTSNHRLQHGDVLVLATDGLWDNLSSQEILAIVSNEMRQAGAWQRTADRGFIVADKLANLVKPESTTSSSRPRPMATLQSVVAASIVGEAKTASLNRKRDGPFAKAWQQQMPYDPFHGGKVDDISVLVIISLDETRINTNDEEQRLKAKL